MSEPTLLWEEIDVEAGETVDYRFKLYKSNKSPLALDLTDVVRFKLARRSSDATPLLDLSSANPTANKSSVTVESFGVDGITPASVIVRLAQADTKNFDFRVQHHGEIGVVDDSETAPDDAYKRAGYGPINIKPSIGGNIGLTP
jgi:hypothetical protein